MSGSGFPIWALGDPQQYAQLQAIQRRQGLGQALLEQGSQDPGSKPYAGLAGAGRQLLGAYLLKHGDQDYANAIGGMFGSGDNGSQGAQGTAPPQMTPSAASTAPPIQPGQPTGQLAASNQPAGTPAMASQGQGQQQPPMPQQMAPQGQQGAAGGNPRIMAIYNSPFFPKMPGVAPEQAVAAVMGGGPTQQAYMTAFFTSAQPTPEQKNALAAAGGDPSKAGQIISGIMQKQSSETLRPGGGSMNYAIGQFTGVPGQTGLTPTMGPNGQMSLHIDPASAQAVATAQYASKFGQGAATPDIAYNGSGQGFATNQAAMLGGNSPPFMQQPGGQGQIPSQPSPIAGGQQPMPPGPPNPLGGGVPQNGANPALAAPPPGAGAFGDAQARSANELNAETRDNASDYQTRLNVLGNVMNLSRITQTNSPEWVTSARTLAAQLGQLTGHPVDASNQAALNAEIQKYMSQYATRLHQTAGGTGSDAQLEAIQHANPNDAMFPATIQRVVPWIMANERAIGAKANAQSSANITTPAQQNQFETWWRTNYTPRIAQFEQMNPQQKLGYLHDKNAFPTQQSILDFQKQYKTLHPYFQSGQ